MGLRATLAQSDISTKLTIAAKAFSGSFAATDRTIIHDFKMTIEFTAHNIRLDNGTLTKPDAEGVISMEAYPWFVSARRIIETVFPGDKSYLRLADLGCCEGGTL